MPDVGRTAPKGKSHVQSVLFAKDEWDKKRARRWLTEHDYYTDGLDETDDLLRYRQYDPQDDKFRYRNKAIGEGITLVNGFPKNKSSLESRGLCGDANIDHVEIQKFSATRTGAEGAAKEVEASSLAELYRAYQEAEAAGDLFKLRAEIIPHLNNQTNANYWEIKPSAYKKIAKTFAGMPFQRDHSLAVADRGGTILDSRIEGDKENAYMVQTIEAVEPWSIKGLLRGTVDRFSIHLNAHDLEAFCSICGSSMMECNHWPGRAYETDKGESVVCRIIVTGGSGKETSAVVDPAVSGTNVKSIQQLVASMRGLPQPSEEDDMELQELQALLASKEEEISATQKELAGLKAAKEAAESAQAQAESARQKAEADLAAALAASNSLRSRVCAQILAQVQEIRAANKILFAKDAPESISAEIHPADEMDRLERVLLADKILIEREARNFGTDFDVQAERQKLLAQPPAALSFALEQIRATALPKVEPPMGRGAPLLPEGDKARVEMPPEPKASLPDEFDTFSIEEQVALATGQADYRR